MTDFAWTEDRIELLKTWWGDGMSASEISQEFGGGPTRSAVIGKLHRLGLQRGIRRQRPDAKPRVARRARFKPPVDNKRTPPVMAAMEPAEPALVLDPAEIPVGQRRTLMQLTDATCRFPYGEGAELFFCGALPVDGLPYCSQHCRIAYRPSNKREVAD